MTALRDLDVEVTEYIPRVAQSMPLPGRLAGLRRRHLAPLTAAWLGLHAVSRLPAIAASRHSDLVWLERSFVPGLERLTRLLKPPIVLDADDAIWLEGLAGRSTPTLAARVDAVIAGNRYLADWFSQYCQRVYIVPTAVDCRRYLTPARPGPRHGVVLGWTGTSGNFGYLTAIQPALARVLREVPGASLLVVADRPPELPLLAGRPVTFERWSEAAEVSALHRMDIGLMPLADDPWTRGKCSFKMLQYMAAELPTVVSPVGMNKEVLGLGESGLEALTTDDWTEALLTLAADPDRRRAMGKVGRAVVERHFDVPVVAAHIAAAFRDVVQGI